MKKKKKKKKNNKKKKKKKEEDEDSGQSLYKIDFNEEEYEGMEASSKQINQATSQA